MSREHWWVKNVSGKEVAIGDLPNVPTFERRGVAAARDLLQFHSMTDINKSQDLKYLFDVGWFRLLKEKDNASVNYSGRNAVRAVTAAQELEAEDVPRTVTTSTSSDYTALSGEYVFADATSGSISITIPTAVGNAGSEFGVKKIDASVNIITLNTVGSQTIDGQSSLVMNSQYDSVVLISNGSNWFIK